MSKNSEANTFIRITDTDRYLQTGSKTSLVINNENAPESARKFVREAVEQNRSIISIIELNRIKGLPEAEREIKRAKWKGVDISLVYGVQISICDPDNTIGNENCGEVILIPRNHGGYKNICKLLTLAYTAYFDKEPQIPYCEIENHGKGIICIFTSDPKRNVLSENGLAELAGLISDDPKFPDWRFTPRISGAEEKIKSDCDKRAHSIYGKQLPEEVRSRLQVELDAIVNNGYSDAFYIAKMMADKAHSDNQLIGFRGLIGSSLVAFFLNITEVNPLAPHYLCPKCFYYEKPEEHYKYETGWELPGKYCPCCGSELHRDGYRIPYEVLFGNKLDREPDIDLNFAPDYCHEELQLLIDCFGEKRVFRAGTAGINGRTGTHPGGVFILPDTREINDYTPLQKPTEVENEDNMVTHIDFHDLDYVLLKVDILKHQGLNYLKKLGEITGIDPKLIPLNEEATLREITKVDKEIFLYDKYDFTCINDFETDYGKSIINSTKPCTFADLIRISALIHGEGVWEDNAKTLLENGAAGITDVITTRDDVMNFLLSLDMDTDFAYKIMDRVRKGRELSDEMIRGMKEAGVPEWYIESCKNIRYVFPRAHAVVYVIMFTRLLWYKVHYPEAYAIVTGIGSNS